MKLSTESSVSTVDPEMCRQVSAMLRLKMLDHCREKKESCFSLKRFTLTAKKLNQTESSIGISLKLSEKRITYFGLINYHPCNL